MPALAVLLVTVALSTSALADSGKSADLSDKNAKPADFHAQPLDGSASVSLGELRGRATIVAFWATWCFPCRYELPLLEKLYRQHRDAGLQVVAVAAEDELARVRKYVAEQGFSFQVLFDGQSAGMKAFGAASVPATFLLDSNGQPVALTDPATGHTGILLDNPLIWSDPATRERIQTLLGTH
jgi:thiol-disulfide isomerase/thioredoxin